MAVWTFAKSLIKLNLLQMSFWFFGVNIERLVIWLLTVPLHSIFVESVIWTGFVLILFFGLNIEARLWFRDEVTVLFCHLNSRSVWAVYFSRFRKRSRIIHRRDSAHFVNFMGNFNLWHWLVDKRKLSWNSSFGLSHEFRSLLNCWLN